MAEISRLPPASQHLERLWQAYLDARIAAEETRAIRDGIAAGKAWAAWLRAFEACKPADAGNVIPLRGRP